MKRCVPQRHGVGLSVVAVHVGLIFETLNGVRITGIIATSLERSRAETGRGGWGNRREDTRQHNERTRIPASRLPVYQNSSFHLSRYNIGSVKNHPHLVMDESPERVRGCRHEDAPLGPQKMARIFWKQGSKINPFPGTKVKYLSFGAVRCGGRQGFGLQGSLNDPSLRRAARHVQRSRAGFSIFACRICSSSFGKASSSRLRKESSSTRNRAAKTS